jgi:hypothetical protein
VTFDSEKPPAVPEESPKAKAAKIKSAPHAMRCGARRCTAERSGSLFSRAVSLLTAGAFAVILKKRFQGGGSAMPDVRKKAKTLLRVAAALALLTAGSQTALYFYAAAHRKEILQNGSAGLLDPLVTVTENAAQANPYLTSSVFCLLLAAACLIGVHLLKKRSG